MSAPQRDFGGFPLAVGEIYGLRVWKVDDYGRLRARHVDSTAWRPGVNTAVCRTSSYPTLASFARAVVAGGGMVLGPSPMPMPEAEPEPEQHTAPGERCACGFYAYTLPSVALAEAGAVVAGVIRGSGRALIGTKGFRCERAEIVALLDPRADDDYLPADGVSPAGSPCNCPNCRVPDAPWEWDVWAAERLRELYPAVPLLPSRAELLRFAPIQSTAPDPSSDEFWELP